MASAIQRLLVLFAFIAAGITIVTPADASVAPYNPAWANIAVASPPNADDADKVAATPANTRKTPCSSRKIERSHKSCPVCRKIITLWSTNRTRTKIPGLQPRAVTGVSVFEQLAVATALTSGKLNLARLAFLQTDFAFGKVFARTGRLRI